MSQKAHTPPRGPCNREKRAVKTVLSRGRHCRACLTASSLRYSYSTMVPATPTEPGPTAETACSTWNLSMRAACSVIPHQAQPHIMQRRTGCAQMSCPVIRKATAFRNKMVFIRAFKQVTQFAGRCLWTRYRRRYLDTTKKQS